MKRLILYLDFHQIITFSRRLVHQITYNLHLSACDNMNPQLQLALKFVTNVTIPPIEDSDYCRTETTLKSESQPGEKSGFRMVMKREEEEN